MLELLRDGRVEVILAQYWRKVPRHVSGMSEAHGNSVSDPWSCGMQKGMPPRSRRLQRVVLKYSGLMCSVASMAAVASEKSIRQRLGGSNDAPWMAMSLQCTTKLRCNRGKSRVGEDCWRHDVTCLRWLQVVLRGGTAALWAVLQAVC